MWLVIIINYCPNRMINIVAGKSLGIVSPIQEEVFIPLSTNTTESDFDDKHDFLESFDNSTWPIDKKKNIEDLLWTHKHVFTKSRHELSWRSGKRPRLRARRVKVRFSLRAIILSLENLNVIIRAIN